MIKDLERKLELVGLPAAIISLGLVNNYTSKGHTAIPNLFQGFGNLGEKYQIEVSQMLHSLLSILLEEYHFPFETKSKRN